MAVVLARCRLQALFHRCSSSSSTLSKEVRRSWILLSGSRRMSSGGDAEAGKAAALRQQLEAAARENRLDLFTAAKILFSTPPKPRKFGLDFHLWQFFVACLPPFAVYLTAQYSRYEMRRMEKERDQAEQLKLQVALGEELAVQAADAESKSVDLSNTSKPGIESPANQQDQKEDSKPKNKDDSIVMLPEKEFLAITARLDAMENKVRLLESVRPVTTFIIPLGSEPNPSTGSEQMNIQKTDAQMADKAEGGEDHQRKSEKQRNGTPLEEQNQKDLQVSLDSGKRSWVWTRSKTKEVDLSE